MARDLLLEAERKLRTTIYELSVQADALHRMAMGEPDEEKVEAQPQKVTLLQWNDLPLKERFDFWLRHQYDQGECSEGLWSLLDELRDIADRVLGFYSTFVENVTAMHDPLTPIMRALLVTWERLGIAGVEDLMRDTIAGAAADKAWRHQKGGDALVDRNGEFLFGATWGATAGPGREWGTEVRWPQNVQRFGAKRASAVDRLLEQTPQEVQW